MSGKSLLKMAAKVLPVKNVLGGHLIAEWKQLLPLWTHWCVKTGKYAPKGQTVIKELLCSRFETFERLFGEKGQISIAMGDSFFTTKTLRLAYHTKCSDFWQNTT